ncbi:transposase [Roseomonas harenae]|uniref:transposase n=1 Tax=Muricoccus harenae TaxID=2692566 RepID=UPI0013316D53
MCREVPRADPGKGRRGHPGQPSHHELAGAREAIRATGASLLHLPPYSPDLNPIEQLFATRKARLQKPAARCPRGALGHHWPPARHPHPSRVQGLSRQLQPCVRVRWKSSREWVQSCVHCPPRAGSSTRLYCAPPRLLGMGTLKRGCRRTILA